MRTRHSLLFSAAVAAVVFSVVGGSLLTRPRPGVPDDPGTRGNPKSHPDRIESDGVTIQFVRVGKGTFWMGSPATEKPRAEWEEQKELTIEEDFEIGKFEVTQEQWEAVLGTGSNPSWFSRTGVYHDRVEGIRDQELKQFPVENVSWNDCQEFLKKLNEREKQRNSRWFYRLPKEAEWEYACRGGPGSPEGKKTAPYYFAKPSLSLSAKQANFCGNLTYGDAFTGTDLKRPCKVGSYEPNALGICDMHGNVFEWCADLLEENSERVMRGGAWVCHGGACRAAERKSRSPSKRDDAVGFRLVRILSGGK